MIEPTADNPQAEDTRADDDASSIGDASTQDSLASLRSSILDYRRENGRTYHRLSDGKCFLSSVPPNYSFEVDDVEKEWTWTAPFDFIFIRAMIASFKSWPDMIAKAYANLEPGGYLEIHDNDFPLKCDDGTMTDECKALKWTKLLIEGTDLMGRPITVARDFKKMLEDAGFVDVVVKKEKWPYTPWPKDPKYKELGEWDKESALQGIEAITMALFTRMLDWSVPETTVFCAEVRNELKRVDIHAYYDVYSVYGQKPEKEPSQAPENNPEE
ncbi:TAM domain methyltransferase [Colletotrichum chrysophilum]|uniref:TAM domain methyltransferase n=2 Tax=Colletotrichum chrysophilum TaxID=1836956 RepID=A0AAD9EQ53_9PEZI|nr:TAM domain methyltransferase [Colletotrichum chrysophilum]